MLGCGPAQEVVTFVEKLRETVTFKVWEFHVEGTTSTTKVETDGSHQGHGSSPQYMRRTLHEVEIEVQASEHFHLVLWTGLTYQLKHRQLSREPRQVIILKIMTGLRAGETHDRSLS